MLRAHLGQPSKALTRPRVLFSSNVLGSSLDFETRVAFRLLAGPRKYRFVRNSTCTGCACANIAVRDKAFVGIIFWF